jgi:hypothetical protein
MNSSDASHKKIMLHFQNESSKTVRISLEPMCEHFIITPNQKVEIHATLKSKSSDEVFTLGIDDELIIIYAPGDLSDFIDCYCISEGNKLVPIEQK